MSDFDSASNQQARIGRKIVVQWSSNDDYDNIKQLLKDFSDYGFGNDLVLANSSGKQFDDVDANQLQFASYVVPEECTNNNSKIKNFILSQIASQLGNFRFLHMIEGNVKLLKDPKSYIEDLEHTMDVLDYGIHFSTTSDACNYLFKKFCPRLTIDIDDDDISNTLKLPSSVSFTSHSNTIWTTYDYMQCDGNCPQLYNEQFTIAMFMIIDYLARRRAFKKDGQLYYMNQYLSIPSEIGVFKLVGSNDNIDSKKMQEEDAIFKTLNIDYSPDNNLDIVLNAFYAKIKQKMA